MIDCLSDDGVEKTRLAELPVAENGWRVRMQTLDDELSVWLDFYQDADRIDQHSRKIWSAPASERCFAGEQHIVFQLYQAVALALNVGVWPADVQQLLLPIVDAQEGSYPLIEWTGYCPIVVTPEIVIFEADPQYGAADPEKQNIVWEPHMAIGFMSDVSLESYLDECNDED